MCTIGLDMSVEKFSCVDISPLISILDCIGNLYALGARCAEQEYASNLRSFKLLNQELVRVFGSLNNQLL